MGKNGWIIQIDHIIDKADRGDENIKSLWALCPNCHSKKTYGAITIAPNTKEVRKTIYISALMISIYQLLIEVKNNLKTICKKSLHYIKLPRPLSSPST